MQKSSLTRFGIPAALAILLVALIGVGCGGDDSGDQTETPTGNGEQAATVEVPADVPFDASEWTTATDYPAIGDPRAVKDDGSRPFVSPWLTFPPTLRTDGPNSNLTTTRNIRALIFESLVQLHPETEEFIPCLASHWKIEDNDDGETQTFWFRIDERAKWADGEPVTALDVYYSFWHRIQEDRKDPSNVITFNEGYEMPEIVDRLTIKVRTKKTNWRLFLYFGGMVIYPAKEIHIPGDRFLSEYNWKYMVGTGPYHLASEDDLKKGESLTLTRRDDWWAENEPWAKHTYNFRRLRYVVIRDRELIYETFKKEDTGLDWYIVGRAQRWVEDIPKEKDVQRGVIQKRKIFNKAPEGYAGLAFNMRKPPFNDRRVRLAFAHLFNRERLIEKLFFNQYVPVNSMFPGRDWGNGDKNELITFDPDRALELLAEAGYENRDDEGYLLGPDGKRLKITFAFGAQSWERIWLVVKEDYEAAGIEFELKLLDGSTLIKLITDRQFLLHFQSWGALLFPNPETALRSDLADKPANNNITGFKNAEVDELLEKYNKVFDRAEQKKITKRIDELFCAEIPYAFGWYAGYSRIMYWNRFGHPDTYFTRIEQDPDNSMILLWWYDAERTKALEKAQAEKGTMPVYDGEGPEQIVKPWDKK
jgi:microcin C transport system substrate-binding protein